jgi:hypothetical protein
MGDAYFSLEPDPTGVAEAVVCIRSGKEHRDKQKVYYYRRRPEERPWADETKHTHTKSMSREEKGETNGLPMGATGGSTVTQTRFQPWRRGLLRGGALPGEEKKVHFSEQAQQVGLVVGSGVAVPQRWLRTSSSPRRTRSLSKRSNSDLCRRSSRATSLRWRR